MRALLYFDGGAGRCCATLFSPQAPLAAPAGQSAPTACLFVPPFGEEMNKSRRMAALLGCSTAASPTWQSLMSRPTVTRLELSAADHTFSRREWRDQVASWTADWIKAHWPGPGPK